MDIEDSPNLRIPRKMPVMPVRSAGQTTGTPSDSLAAATVAEPNTAVTRASPRSRLR